ncbi:MAG: hypothetical protein ACRD8A_14645 [Candidatus Acidiferrales bacterium]
MPIGTRLSTPIPRNYLHDERLNSITDALAREAYIRAKLVCDNLGRLPAHPATLASTLFPAMPPASAKMSRIIAKWVEVGLVFHYQVGTRQYVEITDNGETSKLVGNMTGESEYPPPPDKMIADWNAQFCGNWKAIQRKSKRVHTGSNAYHTRSPEEKRSEVKRSEESGVMSKGTAADAANGDCDGRPTGQSDSDLTDGLTCTKVVRDHNGILQFAGLERNRLGKLDPMFIAHAGIVFASYKKTTHQNNHCDCDPAVFLDELITSCKGVGIPYPKGALARLKELQRRAA